MSNNLKCPRCGSDDTSVSISIKLGSGGDPAGGLSIDRITCKSCGFDLPLGGLSGTAAQALLSAMGSDQSSKPAAPSHAPTPPSLPKDFEPITVAGPGTRAANGAAPEAAVSVLEGLPSVEGESDVLLEVASPQIYRKNAFRVTGLSVDASTRDLDRASEKLRMLEKFGGGASRSGGPLALDPPPSADELREAVQRLHDPEGRLVDELFWFWPAEIGRSQLDAALAALGRGDLTEAEKAWKDREREGTVASISTHNLAILSHFWALEMELQGSTLQERDRLWREALRRWQVVLREEAFWDRVEARARELDDPRLTRGSVLRMRGTLPKALLSISAQLALAAAQRGDRDDARRHVEHMRAAGFDPGLVNDALRDVLEPQISRLRMLAKRAEEEGDADPVHADAFARRLLEQAPPLLAVVDALLDQGHPARATIHDEVAVHLLGCQITHGNKTGEWNKSIELLLPTLEIVEGEAARARIEQNLTIVRGNEEHRQVWGACWFCKEERPADSAAIEVKMHGEVERTPTFQGTRITWRHGTIGVPRCAKCEEAHLTTFLWYLWFPLSFIMPYIFMPASWIRFVPRFKKYPTPAMGSLLGFSLGMLIMMAGGWVWAMSVSGRAENAREEAMAAKWAQQTGLSQVPGGTPVSPAGLPIESQRMLNDLRLTPSQDEVWGDVGDAFNNIGNARAAEACWAIARLIDQGDGEWQGHSPDLELADDALLGLGVLDAFFAQNLATGATLLGDDAASSQLYQLALAINPGDPNARDQVGGDPPQALMDAVAAMRTQLASSGVGGTPTYVPGSVAGGVVGSPAGSSLAASVRSSPSDDEQWGDLGDAYSAQGNSRMAEACWAVARLLDQADSEWQGHSPDVELADDALLGLGVLDGDFTRSLGDAASVFDDEAAASQLYQLALAINPGDSYSRGQVGGDPPQALVDAVAAKRTQLASSGFGGAPTSVPGGVLGGVVGGPAASSLGASVRSSPSNDEQWGDLGDAYSAQGNSRMAEACWAVALLLDPTDDEWQNHSPRVSLADDALLEVGVFDGWFASQLGDAANNEGYYDASETLYDIAAAVGGKDSQWERRNPSSSLVARVEEAQRRQGVPVGSDPPQDTAVALAAVLSDAANDEKWGDLGDAYAAVGDSTAAEACWAIALLRDEYDQEWVDHHPDPGLIVDYMLAHGIPLDDYVVGDLARTAEYQGRKAVSQELFELAWALDPADPEWSDMHKGEQVPASYATPIAEARAAQERRQREQSAQSAMANLRTDPSYAYAWGNAADQLLIIGDTARATLLFSMAHALDPNGGWKRYPEVDRSKAAEAVRALGITDDEAVGRLASTASAGGSSDAARALFALALEMDPTDPQWKMEIEQGSATRSRAWFFPFVNVLVAAGLALYGARRGRTRRVELGLEEKPKRTKEEGWKMEFPPIKEKLAAGWQLGEKPPDATGTA